MLKYEIIGMFENEEEGSVLRIAKLGDSIFIFANDLVKKEAVAFVPTKEQLVEIGKAIVKAWEIAS